MKIKVNRYFKVDPFNISKIISKDNQLWLVMESGYPKRVLLADSLPVFRLKLANCGLTKNKIEEIING